jgi:outer membrane protein TolC
MLQRLLVLLPLLPLAAVPLRGQTPLSIQDAIRADEPMQAFGTRLYEARITQADFLPSSLNRPSTVAGTSASLTLSQPLYAGGRLDAARRAGADLAGAEAASQEQRKQQAALAITQVYFGVQVAEQGVRFAEDSLKQAAATDDFVQARVADGLLLRSDGERTRAYRAQCEAGLLEARARVASARSGLALLVGADVAEAPLSTPLEVPAGNSPDAPAGAAAPEAGQRPDLASLRQQAAAAREGVQAALGSLKPEVGVQVSAGTLRQAWNVGGNWTTLSLGATWTFSFARNPQVQTAQAKIAYARAAVAASESVRTIRTARHREGLLPLVDVLDAETSLTGARTLLLSSQLDLRLGEAQLALALGQPIENVNVKE